MWACEKACHLELSKKPLAIALQIYWQYLTFINFIHFVSHITGYHPHTLTDALSVSHTHWSRQQSTAKLFGTIKSNRLLVTYVHTWELPYEWAVLDVFADANVYICVWVLEGVCGCAIGCMYSWAGGCGCVSHCTDGQPRPPWSQRSISPCSLHESPARLWQISSVDQSEGKAIQGTLCKATICGLVTIGLYREEAALQR